MMRRWGLLISALALVAVLAVAFVGYNVLGARENGKTPAPQAVTDEQPVEQPAEQPEEQASGPMLAAYDATVYTADGAAATLTQIANGKPLVINFWATWCPYCVEEMPDLQAIYHEYSDRVIFAFIDATDGGRETVSAASVWLSENGFEDLPAYYDIDYDAISMLGVRAFPTTVLVSADGEIVAFASGMIDPDRLRTALDELV